MTLDFEIDPAHARWVIEPTAGRREAWWTRLFGPAGFEAYGRILPLPDPQYPGQTESEIEDHLIVAAPDDAELLQAAAQTLSDESGTPDDLYILFWGGYPFDPPLVLAGDSRLEIPGMGEYVLARGSVSDWNAWIAEGNDRYPAAFLWPADRAWCFAYDVDVHFVGVGASERAFDLLAKSGLEVDRWDREVTPPTYF